MAGLCGATLRVVNTFMVAICGTHMHTSMNSFLGIAPMFLLSYILTDPDCGYRTLVGCAAMSGIGGGAFSSSMSSISFFFPKKRLGIALNINAGFGNLGVSVGQMGFPLLCSVAAFGGVPISVSSGLYPRNCALLLARLAPATPRLGTLKTFLGLSDRYLIRFSNLNY